MLEASQRLFGDVAEGSLDQHTMKKWLTAHAARPAIAELHILLETFLQACNHPRPHRPHGSLPHRAD